MILYVLHGNEQIVYNTGETVEQERKRLSFFH